MDKNDPKIWAYTRTTESEVLLVINNFYGEEITYSVPHVQLDGMKQEVLLSNYKDASKDITKLSLRPYESIVYRYTNKGCMPHGHTTFYFRTPLYKMFTSTSGLNFTLHNLYSNFSSSISQGDRR